MQNSYVTWLTFSFCRQNTAWFWVHSVTSRPHKTKKGRAVNWLLLLISSPGYDFKEHISGLTTKESQGSLKLDPKTWTLPELIFFLLFWGLKTFNQLSSQDIWFLCTPALVGPIWGKKCQNHHWKGCPGGIFSPDWKQQVTEILSDSLFSGDFPAQFCWPKHSPSLGKPWISNCTLRPWFLVPIVRIRKPSSLFLHFAIIPVLSHDISASWTLESI